ncbi:MAG: hypothetical protein ACE5EM_08530 [Sphingomonadales bacterium]
MKRSIGRVFAVSSLALLLTAAIPGEIMAASDCVTSAQAKAARIRAVQTELMVAALKCDNRPGMALRDSYNQFVERFSPILVAQARILTGHFKHQFGADFERHQDRFITGLANRISIASNRDPGFCRSADTFVQSLLASASATSQLDTPLLVEPKLKVCPAVAVRPMPHRQAQ